MRTYMNRLRRRLSHDERGTQTVEWVGIGGVVAAVVAAIITAVAGSGLGEQIVEAIEAILEQIRFQPITPVPYP